ncbi:DNA polymerase III subunit alpha [Sediminibacterium roseum]|uniref:Error-prone DNA polymerase n=1 Tax=Sediminibacterium roseum TaxID=1978412 RepID=A0ABW9ZSS7_9BACT|nr:error-prone DNA polymerase [Sediminibacterium roseum]NCI48792.1 DNA polymerase III subunit alpha [Sediminibacterium roseum]
MAYTELQVTSNFSFLRGASHPQELVEHAAVLGYTRIAITDRNTLAGIVRAHVAAKKSGMKLLVGCRLDLVNGPSLLVYPTNRKAYASLCTLLSTGNLRTEKGKCELYKEDVYAHAAGMKLVVVPPPALNEDFDFEESFRQDLAVYRHHFGADLYIAASRYYQGDDAKYLFRIHQLSLALHVPMVATNDVHYHSHERRELQDIVTCVREKCTIYNAGYKLHPNAERYLKEEKEMERLFRQYPDAIARTQEIADLCPFSLDELRYEFPDEIVVDGKSPQQQLEELAWQGAYERYGAVLPAKIIHNIKYELGFIEKMQYAPFFLVVEDAVREARRRKILCQGRGSAANSTVCYCLGITAVDPTKHELLFERFISDARNEPPDIDVDFEHERREEIIQYIYNKYGRDRAGIVATVTQLHQKGAIRDVAKAMGLSVDTISALSNSVWEFTDEWLAGRSLNNQGFNESDHHLKKMLELTGQFISFPRQLGQHTGGFVITRGKLHELCPILNARMENRTCIEWNKDDIDALGILKVDVLALGMLTCIRKAFDLARNSHGLDLTLATVPPEDSRVYDMICEADTIGVFQIESRAQQSMLPRLKPRSFYDLVIEVAIVRPGPIQGDMVHPYLRRRNGTEKIEYPSEDLKEILNRTLGVPLFQEQAMKIAIVAAGFTPAEADELRRAMATFKLQGLVTKFEQKLINGMLERGYTEEYAKRVFRQLEGFGSYGFPESHAASFALLVYVSCWLKKFYPDVFACALLNSYPMGFYQPAQIIIDARKHGVDVREIDINHSYWDNTLEEKTNAYCALRIGFRQVKGLREDDIEILVTNRRSSYKTINELRDIGLSGKTLTRLADADAFRSLGLDRRQALWEVSTKDNPEQLFKGQTAPAVKDEQQIELPFMELGEHVVQDYASTGLSLKAHPVSFVRQQLEQLRITACADIGKARNGERIKVAGLVLVRQRPGTAKGVIFMTIEDETGNANAVVWEKVFEANRKEILTSRLIMLEGKLQIEGLVIHVVVEKCYNLSPLLRNLTPDKPADPAVLTLSRADERSLPAHVQREQAKNKDAVFYGGRNFK